MAKAKKTAKRRAKKGGTNKSAFIRSQTGTAREIVEAGKAKGILFSEGLVYAVRSQDKSKGTKKKRGPGRPKGSSSAAPKRTTNGRSGGTHSEWIAQAFAMGIDRAIKTLTAVRDAIG